jgi:transposase
MVRKDWTTLEWEGIIFSDECSLERGAGKQPSWVFRTPKQKWDKEMIDTYTKGKDISVMIWGAIWIGGRSEIVIMERDPDTPRQGYSAASYIRVLEDQLPQWYEPGMTFMQDNARIHTARAVRNWLEEHGVAVTDWPPYSPDLNPIEIIWAIMKRWINEHYPDLKDMGATIEAYEELCRVIKEAWEAIPQADIDSLIKSMDTRVEAVRLAKGWYTRF